jgi:parallel beta-helix repeat protein
MDSTQSKESIFLSVLSAAFFILWGGLLIVNPVMAATITVCPAGCDNTTIQVALNNASSGDTVLVGTPLRVAPEIYNENFAMKSGVDVISEGDNSTNTYMIVGGHTITAMNRAMNTVIHGIGHSSVVGIPNTVTTDVTLDGFTIENVTAEGQFLVRVMHGAPTIKNNIIRNNSSFGGIGLTGFGSPISPTIKNNLIHSVYGPGIGNGNNSSAIIDNNEIWDCNGTTGVGIGMWGYVQPTITNNIIFNNNRAGISSNATASLPFLKAEGGTLTIPTIKGNIIHDNGGFQGAGIRLVREPGDTGTITVTIGDSGPGGNNTIYGSGTGAGIWLEDLTNVTIEKNYVYDHFLGGISLTKVDNAIIRSNETSFNQSGIEFDSTCVNATVEDNQIHDNNRAGINNGVTTIGHPAGGGVHRLIVQNGNNIYSNGTGGDGSGIIIEYAGSTNIIKDNTIHHNSSAGIGVNATASVTITHNEINNNTRGGILINDAVSDSTIDGNNTIHGNLMGGIRIAAANSVTVEDNQIFSNGYGGIYYVGVGGAGFLSVNGTDIYSNSRGGIEINYDGGDGNITRNTIYSNHYGGIGIKTPCTFVISENQIDNNLRGGIHTGDQSAGGGGFTSAPGTAVLTIKKNKVYHNGLSGYGGGIDVRHAGGTIYNNLVYKNHRAGIRFGDNITAIINNTVVSNGNATTATNGAGIVYDDLAGDVNAEPGGYASNEIPIKNNICTNNLKAGIRVNIDPDGACPTQRDYNLLCQNNGITDITCPPPPPYYCEYMQLYMCPKNTNEIFDDFSSYDLVI